jgi:hypothetical protein
MSVFDALRYEKFMSVYALGGLEKHYLSENAFSFSSFPMEQAERGRKLKKRTERKTTIITFSLRIHIALKNRLQFAAARCRCLRLIKKQKQCNVSLKLQQQIYGLKIKTLKLCCCRSTSGGGERSSRAASHAGKSYFIALLPPSRC